MHVREKLRFSDEELQRAGSVNILDYARQLGLEPVQISTSSYKIPEYGGLYIDAEGKRWNHFSENAGGGVIQFAMHMEKKSWVEAVRQLLDQSSSYNQMEPLRKTEKTVIEKEKNEEKGEFILPEKNTSYKHMFAYLIGHRKIDKDIVYNLVKQGKLYENTQRSCVFVGKDKEGQSQYATVRSTNTFGKSFRGDVKGSDKSFGFCMEGNSNVVRVFESPIDAMSFATMMKPYLKENSTRDHMLSLGGVSDRALDRYLKEHPEIKRISLCLDNDQAGHSAADNMLQKYKENYKVSIYYPKSKDWNEDLQKYAAANEKKLESELEEAMEL